VKPVLIVLEGPDGVGKSAHVRELVQGLEVRLDMALSVASWAHPRFVGDDPWQRALWYAQARARFAADVRAGRYDDFVVVIDRWYFSTLVAARVDEFRGDCLREHAPALSDDICSGMERLCEGERSVLPPVRVILLDAPSEVIAKRLQDRSEKVFRGNVSAQRCAYVGVMQTTRATQVNTADALEVSRARVLEIARGIIMDSSK
jgi:thymidylate kinase